MKLKINATDIAAYLVIIGCMVLIALGVNDQVWATLGIATGWAFRKPIVNGTNAIAARVKVER